MPKKCSTYGCRSGYAGVEDKVPVYSFPLDHLEKLKWVQAMPDKLSVEQVTKYMGLCAKHFPDAKMKKAGKFMVPADPPTYFPDAPSSCTGTPHPKSRTTTKSTTAARIPDEDQQMKEFLEKDKFYLNTFTVELNKTLAKYPGTLVWGKDKDFSFFSESREGPIKSFSIYFTSLGVDKSGCIKELSYEAYAGLRRIKHPAINKGIKCWSQFEELINFVCSPDENFEDEKFQFIYRQIYLLNLPRNNRIYSMDDICQAFSWYALSRHLYSKLRDVLQLPSITTLQRLTRMSKNMEDVNLFTSYFQSQEERNRACILIADEVYVKASLTYRGGEVFGRAEDQKGKLAHTLLCIMMKCLFTKEKLLTKLIPCHALNADFAYQSISNVILTLENCGATVIGLITDNNRVNQCCFSKFTAPCQDTPWIVRSPGVSSNPLFLIYDPVHLIKNIRNNWVTEKMKTLAFSHENETKFACWRDLEELQKHEASGMVKMSKLTESTVNPSNLEKQKVSLVLNVFCDQTMTALRMSEHTCPSWQSTASFIGLVVQLWKLLNCKSKFQAKRFNDPDRGVIAGLHGNQGYELLRHWGGSNVLFKPESRTRVQTLTIDTSNALSWTCHALADLAKFLLETNAPYKHDYVCLGFYQQDDLERHFGHFRMSAGGNFFLTTQEVFATHNIDKARFMLQCCEDYDTQTSVSRHKCEYCEKPLTETEYLIIDDMVNLQSSVSYDERLSLLYIGGYIAFKHEEVRGEANEFSEDVRTYLEGLNRGGLQYPSSSFFDFVSLAYIFFTKSPENMCRSRLVNVWKQFPEIFGLNIVLAEQPLMRLANIYFKRYCLTIASKTDGKTARKAAKLSSSSTR